MNPIEYLNQSELLSAIITKLDSLTQEVHEKFDSVHEKFDSVHEKIHSLTREMYEIKGSVDSLKEDMDWVKATLQEGLVHGIETIDVVRGIDIRMSVIEQLFPTHRTFVVSLPPNYRL